MTNDCGLQTYDSVICSTHGNYGSTVFDAMDESDGYLIFILCDKCLLTRKGVYRYRKGQELVVFDPDDYPE